MSLIKYQPRRSRTSLLDSFFDDVFTPDRFFNDLTNERVFQPSANISEKPKAYHIELAVPGFDKDSFSLELNDHVLQISGRHDEVNTNEEKTYSLREFKSASFKRSFTLPETIQADKIEAQYEQGVLMIILPKKEEAQPQSRTIPVR